MLETTIQVEDVKKTLHGREILKGINFEVKKGDVFGFLGPNGAGKTTTIRIIMGLYHADEGRALILGENPDGNNVRTRVGFVLDRDGLYENMSAEKNLACFLKLYGKKAERAVIEKALDMVGLKNRAADKIGTYSKGMRQRAAIARAIVHDPEVLILDEPTSGVDPTEQINIRNMLLDIAEKSKKTVFLSTHNMDEVQKICSRIALLNKGKIQLYGEVEHLRKTMGDDTVSVKVGTLLTDEIRDRLLKNEELGFRVQNEYSLIFTPKAGVKSSDIISELTDAGVEIEGMKKGDISLEDLYAAIVKENGGKKAD